MSTRAWGSSSGSTTTEWLWATFRRLLYQIGLSRENIDEQTVTNAPLIRIRPTHRTRLALTHMQSESDDEPLCFIRGAPSQTALFHLHTDASDHARLACLHDHRWLARDPVTTEVIALPVSQPSSAMTFRLRSSPLAGATAIGAMHLEHGSQESLAIGRGSRARVVHDDVREGPRQAFLLSVVPLRMDACRGSYEVVVRLQTSRGWFVGSRAGCSLKAASGGRDSVQMATAFVLVVDCAAMSARLRDARGLYLAFDDTLTGLIAAPERGHGVEREEEMEEEEEEDEMYRRKGRGQREGRARTPERFDIGMVGVDDDDDDDAVDVYKARFENGDEADAVTLCTRKGYVSATRDRRIGVCGKTRPGSREYFHLRLGLEWMLETSAPKLDVHSWNGGGREVEGSISIGGKADVAYALLRDYDNLHKIVGDLHESGVMTRQSDTRATVRMVQTHAFLGLQLHLGMVLDVTEVHEERRVCMQLRHGFGVRQYGGNWRVDEVDAHHCVMRCTLGAVPVVPAPAFLLDGLMRHAARDTLIELRAECIRRST